MEENKIIIEDNNNVETMSGNGAIFDFLYAEAEKPKEVEIKISTRIPYKFKVRPLTLEEHKEFQKKATKMNIVGKKKEMKFDIMSYHVDSAIACCIEPNFKDSNNIKKANCITPEMLLSKLLLPGEIIELGTRISEISGFDDNINDEIEEAKNY
nr:MAG TPA: tail assembly chaperone protein [Caudoviricetes sp.]